MEPIIFRELATDFERLNALETMCLKSDKMSITETYESDEMKDHFDEWRQKRIELEAKTKAFKEIEAEYKAAKKKLEIEIRSEDSVLLHQTFTTEQKVYLFPDYNESLMGIYNSKGVLISSRRLLPDERQLNFLDGIEKNGTNN